MKKLLKKRITIASILILSCFLLLVYLLPSLKESIPLFKTTQPVTETIKEQEAVRGDLLIAIAADGNASIPLAYADFGVSGKLVNVFFKAGQSFKKGDVLAEIDTEDYQKSFNQSQNSYKKALINYNDTKQQKNDSMVSEKQKLDNLKEEYDKKQDDYSDALKKYSSVQISVDDYNTAIDNLKTAKEAYENQLTKYNNLLNDHSIELSEISLKDSEENMNNAKNNLDKTKLIAESDGLIVSINKDVGTIVNVPGSSTTDATDHFIAYINSKMVQVKANVSESDIRNIKVSQDVNVKFESTGDEVSKAKVIEVKNLPKVDSNGIVTYEVISEFEDTEGLIKESMSGTLSYIIRGKTDAVYIPNKAVKFVDGVQYVEVKDNTLKYTKRPITTGLSDGENVEITKGLTQGEIVIIRGG